MNIREVISYKNYFKDYLSSVPEEVQAKLFFVIAVLENQKQVSTNYVKHITGSEGIYEIRVSSKGNQYRVLFFLEASSLVEGGELIILGNGFLKKSDKDTQKAVRLAEKIKLEYFEERDRKSVV